MFAKLVIIGFLALYVCQGTVEAKTTSFALSPKAQRGLIDVIQQGIQEIIELVHNLAAQAEELLKKLIESIKDQAEQIIQEAHEIISAIVTDIKEKVKELIEHAQEIQAGVIDCALEQYEAIQGLQDAAIQGVRECVGDKVSQAQEIVEHALAEINALKNKAIELVNKFRECNGSITCLMSIVTEIYAVIQSIPEKVQKIIAEVRELISQIQGEVPGCLRDVAVSVAEQGRAIITAIQECINDKING